MPPRNSKLPNILKTPDVYRRKGVELAQRCARYFVSAVVFFPLLLLVGKMVRFALLLLSESPPPPSPQSFARQKLLEARLWGNACSSGREKWRLRDCSPIVGKERLNLEPSTCLCTVTLLKRLRTARTPFPPSTKGCRTCSFFLFFFPGVFVAGGLFPAVLMEGLRMGLL